MTALPSAWRLFVQYCCPKAGRLEITVVEIFGLSKTLDFKTTTLRSCHSHGHTRTTVIDSHLNSLLRGLEPFLLPSILLVLSPYFTFIPKSSLSVH